MTGGRTMLGVSWASVSVGTFLVALRLYSRGSRKALSGDDYTIAVALIICLSGSVANTFQVLNGGGQHVEEVHPTQASQWEKWTLIFVFQTTVATCLIKISICLFILRLLGPTHRRIWRLILGLLSFLVVITLAFLITLLLQCRPFKAAYDPEVKGQCYSNHVLWSVNYALGAYNIFTDFFCASLPAFIIRDLQISTRTKYALSALMGLGVFTATCSIIKLATLYTVFHEDAIHDSITTEIFAILEGNLGVIVASIPTLQGVFHMMVHEFRSRSKYLRSLLGKRATNAENFDNDNSEVSIMKRTKREYYELQEVATTPQNLHTSKEHKGLDAKEV